MISTRASSDSALTISIACRSAMLMAFTGKRTSISIRSRCSNSSAVACIAAQSMRPPRRG